jgi:hypothetical protein
MGADNRMNSTDYALIIEGIIGVSIALIVAIVIITAILHGDK